MKKRMIVNKRKWLEGGEEMKKVIERRRKKEEKDKIEFKKELRLI